MPKIAIILSSNTHWAPYFSRYVNLLNDLNLEFDFILWNRENISETISSPLCNLIEFRLQDSTNDGSPFKVFKFFKFASFVKKKLRQNNYSKIIFLGTYALIPAIFSKFLEKKYAKKYWIDLRDLTYEKIPIYQKLERRAIKHSYWTVISSKGFLPYLPSFDYGFVHNIDSNLERFSSVYKKSTSSSIRICYIGNISYYDECKSLLSSLANDKRFEVFVVGPNHEPLKRYCEEKEIYNVHFSGRFKREETINFYNNADIVYNAYGNDSLNVKTASSNKLYYSLRFRLPLLVSSGTYMEELGMKYGFSFTFDYSYNFADKLFFWYQNLKKRQPQYDLLWNQVSKEDDDCFKSLERFLLE